MSLVGSQRYQGTDPGILEGGGGGTPAGNANGVKPGAGDPSPDKMKIRLPNFKRFPGIWAQNPKSCFNWKKSQSAEIKGGARRVRPL